MATKRKYIGPKGSRIKNGLGSSEAAGIQVKSGPSINLGAATALRNDAAKLKSKLGRKRFAVGEERLLSMPGGPGGLTKRGQPNAAQIRAVRQTAKNILGSSESGRSKGGKGKKKR